MRKTRFSLTAFLSAALLALPASAQMTDYFSNPEDGGDFRGEFTLMFFEEMQDPIAIRFDNTGGVQFDSAWDTFGGLIPNQMLKCTPRGALPPGNIVTWTINPDGTGFTTVGGRVLSTSSGTFVVPAGTGDVTMTPNPRDGFSYDPESDGPVTFTFSEAMDTSIDPNDAVGLSPGTWTCVWADDRTIACTLESPAAAVEYFYIISGLETAFGVTAPEFEGSFTILAGDLVTVSMPQMWYDPAHGPLLLGFSHEMDQSVDLESAVSIFPGTWQFAWGSAFTLECTPIGRLESGPHTYSLDVDAFRSIDGLRLDPMGASGMFPVFTDEGTPAPDCPPETIFLPFPKTVSVCGSDYSAWDVASAYPDGAGTGYVVSGWSGDGIDSLIRLDAQGQTTATVMALDAGTDLMTGPDPSRFLAARLSDDFEQVELGVYEFNAARTPVFQRALSIEDPDVSTDYLSNGGIAVVQDLDTHIEVILLNANGSVAWAKRYASPLFGVENGGGFGFGQGQSVMFSEMPSGYLLDVAQTKYTEAGIANTNILVRLNDNGSVQWARTQGSDDSMGNSFVHGLSNGSILIWGTSFDENEEDDSVVSRLVRLSPGGDVTWAKQVSGLYLIPLGELPGDKLLLSGLDFAEEEEEEGSGHAHIVTLNPNGTVDRSVKVDRAGGFGFAMVDGQRIRYSFLSPADLEDPDSPSMALIATSSLELENWIWREYTRPVYYASLMPEPNSSEVLFSAFRDTAHALDVIRLSDNLQATAPCTLFTDVSIGILPANLTTTDINITLSAASITVTDFSPVFQNTSIPLQSFTVADRSICAIDPGEPTPVKIDWSLTEIAGQIRIEFLSVPGFNYTIERTGQLGPEPTWTVVEVIEGTGDRTRRSLSVNGDRTEMYLRVTTSR